MRVRSISSRWRTSRTVDDSVGGRGTPRPVQNRLSLHSRESQVLFAVQGGVPTDNGESGSIALLLCLWTRQGGVPDERLPGQGLQQDVPALIAHVGRLFDGSLDGSPQVRTYRFASWRSGGSGPPARPGFGVSS